MITCRPSYACCSCGGTTECAIRVERGSYARRPAFRHGGAIPDELAQEGRNPRQTVAYGGKLGLRYMADRSADPAGAGSAPGVAVARDAMAVSGFGRFGILNGFIAPA